jgi:tetratricopeptide (TPR) repeat protein
LFDRLLAQRPFATTLLLAIFCAVVFYLLRSQQTLLGDAYPLTVGLPEGERFHPRQPVTMWLQQQLYQGLGGLFRSGTVDNETVAFKTTALGSIALGFLFVFIASALGHALVRDRSVSKSVPWLVTLVLMSQGYALLFFGYVENYTFYIVFVGLYILLALLYLQGRITLQLVVVAFFVSMALHLSTLGLLPSLLFLIGWGLLRGNRADAIMGFVVAVAGFFVLDLILGKMSPTFSLWDGLAELTKIARSSQGGGKGLTYMFSWVHVRDFFNEHYLIGPLAAFFLVPAFAYAVFRRRAWSATGIFLILAAGSYFAGSWTMSEPLLGYARDWDLFAPAGVVYTIAGMYLLVTQVSGSERLQRLLAFAVVFSMLQLAPFARITHSQQLSLERFKYLPLGYGRTEVVVGNWYLRHGQRDQAETWLKRALEVYPYNANAFGFLGTMYAQDGNHDLAAQAFERAVALRPDKKAFHNNLARSLIELERYEDAIPQLDWLVKRDRQNVGYWRAFKRIFLALDRPDKVAEVNEQILVFVQRALNSDPNNVNALLEAGILLSELGHDDEAYNYFGKALQLEPESEAALFNTGMLLTRLGRQDEARPLLEKFLALYPDHAHAGWARGQLAR